MSDHFLMKIHQLDERKLKPGKTTWSIKLDGMSSFWDGGITRGRNDVPWCKGEFASGLWSANGKIINAPDYWLAQLPKMFLHGELWAGCGNFNIVSSVCRTKNITPEIHIAWRQIQFKVFAQPIPSYMYSYRKIDDPNCKITIDSPTINYMKDLCKAHDLPWTFTFNDEIANGLKVEEHEFTNLYDVPFDEIIEDGHEGVVFRNPGPWLPIKSWTMMKWKPENDAEGQVVGFTGGKDGNYGKIGAFLVKYDGMIFKLSGMTQAVRESNNSLVCEDYAGKEIPIEYHVESNLVPLGSTITFKYRELTPAGVPREARYERIRDEI